MQSAEQIVPFRFSDKEFFRNASIPCRPEPEPGSLPNAAWFRPSVRESTHLRLKRNAVRSSGEPESAGETMPEKAAFPGSFSGRLFSRSRDIACQGYRKCVLPGPWEHTPSSRFHRLPSVRKERRYMPQRRPGNGTEHRKEPGRGKRHSEHCRKPAFCNIEPENCGNIPSHHSPCRCAGVRNIHRNRNCTRVLNPFPAS